jgi:hypothetical protein
MYMQLLELAIPEACPVELSTVSTAWGPSDTTICLVSGTVLGLLSSYELGRTLCRKHRVQRAVASFRIIELVPMLRHLPSAFEVPTTPRLLEALGVVASSSAAWALWCEPDIDQAPMKEHVLEPRELLLWLERALRPGPLADRTFLATHGL